MKKYIYKIAIFASLAFFGSCEKGGDPVIFDDQNGQTLVSFANTSADLAILIDATGSVEIPIEVSTISSTERTFQVSVVYEETTADSTSYSFDSIIVIPANAYNATLSLDGIDNNVEVESKALVLSIDEGDGYVTGPNITVSIFQVCPVETGSFTGDYTVEVITPGIFDLSTFGPDGGTVSLTETSPTERAFTADYLADDRFPLEWRFSLVCNETVIQTLDTQISCDSDNEPFLVVTEAEVNGLYDANDDSSFILNVTDNRDSDCNTSPVQASYRFVKQ